MTRILGIFQVLAALDLTVGVPQDRGGQRIVVMPIAVTFASLPNRMVEWSSTVPSPSFVASIFLTNPAKTCAIVLDLHQLSIFSGLLP